MKRVLFKVIVPAVIIAVWMLTCYPVCNKAEGFDGFLYWIIAGCPFGVRRMCLWLIPKNFGISGSIVLSVKLDAPAPCRLDAPDLDLICYASADCLHQHLQVI